MTTRLDGRFIKPGSIPADRLDPDISLGGGGGTLTDGSVTFQKLATTLLRKFVVVTWGEALDTTANTKLVPLQLTDYMGNAIPTAHILRITCDDRAQMNCGEHGQALSGADSSDFISRTDATGLLDLVVLCPVSTTITIVAGATQGSPLLDTVASIDLVFE